MAIRLNWRRGGLALAALLVLAGLGMSAQAALKAIIAHAGNPVATTSRPTGYEAEDHFPGAALLYASDTDMATVPRATGTIAPAMPVPAGGFIDPTIHPAPPFSFGAASATDRSRALQCLTAAIYYEAATEPEPGQAAVAQVILNRVRHPAFPHTVCGVVYQGSEQGRCQFSFACDGSTARAPVAAYWARATRIAAAALAGHVESEIGMATHYHSFAVTPVWNRQLIMTAAIGRHFFHRWAGWWGTPAAFSAAYLGHEPEPGPRVTAPAIALPGPAIVTAPKRTMIQQAYADSGQAEAQPAAPANDPELPESTILDKWKGSGQPLR